MMFRPIASQAFIGRPDSLMTWIAATETAAGAGDRQREHELLGRLEPLLDASSRRGLTLLSRSALQEPGLTHFDHPLIANARGVSIVRDCASAGNGFSERCEGTPGGEVVSNRSGE